VRQATRPVKDACHHHLRVTQSTNHKAPHYEVFSFSLYSILFYKLHSSSQTLSTDVLPLWWQTSHIQQTTGRICWECINKSDYHFDTLVGHFTTIQQIVQSNYQADTGKIIIFSTLGFQRNYTGSIIQGDQKASLHMIITVQKTRKKYFKQFQSLTMIM
jgi:hypothetical protein